MVQGQGACSCLAGLVGVLAHVDQVATSCLSLSAACKLRLANLNSSASLFTAHPPSPHTCPPRLQEVLSEQLRQQQELQRKLAKLGKQMDHLER